MTDEYEQKAWFFPDVGELDKLRLFWKKRAKNINCSPQLVIDEIWMDTEKLLKQKELTLRLRKIGNEAFVAIKGPVRKVKNCKVREELETGVANLEKIGQIFRLIGLKKDEHSEKYREIFDLGATVGTIDSFPDLGCVVEIEGSAEDIELEKERMIEIKLSREFSSITHGEIVEEFHKLTGKYPKRIFENTAR
ncbi:MAG: CYTH domain-containing protein [Candidatus Kariarchaeaceae archaeon]